MEPEVTPCTHECMPGPKCMKDYSRVQYRSCRQENHICCLYLPNLLEPLKSCPGKCVKTSMCNRSGQTVVKNTYCQGSFDRVCCLEGNQIQLKPQSPGHHY